VKYRPTIGDRPRCNKRCYLIISYLTIHIVEETEVSHTQFNIRTNYKIELEVVFVTDGLKFQLIESNVQYFKEEKLLLLIVEFKGAKECYTDWK